MKTLKHVFAVVLTLALLFALTAPAFADGSITVMEPGSHTYTAYKIFDVTDDGSGNLTYTATDPWKTAIQDALVAGEVGGLVIANDGTVTKLADFKAADFAAWAKDNVPSSATAISFSEVSGKMTTGDVDPGYYLVFPTDGDVASLCTVLDSEIAIQNKNDMPFDKKAEEGSDWVDESGVQIGDVVNFKITGKVPELDADQASYFYLVSDRLSEGLTLLNDSTYPVVVEIGGTEITMTVVTDPNAELEGNQIRFITDNGRLCGFDLSLDVLDYGKAAATQGADIEITYSALVNSDAINQINENNATLDYGDETTQHHKDSMTKHYTSVIVIDKYETGSPESKVPGAKFVLKNADGKFYHLIDTPAQAAVEDDPGTPEDESRPAQPARYEVEWVNDAANATIAETDAEGGASFPGLKDGTYYLVETEAPAGYTLLTDEIEVVVDGSDSTAVGLTPAQVTLALSEFVRVANTPGSLLPSTGGIGTTIFYIGGGVLVLAAIVVILLASRKKNTKANN